MEAFTSILLGTEGTLQATERATRTPTQPQIFLQSVLPEKGPRAMVPQNLWASLTKI